MAVSVLTPKEIRALIRALRARKSISTVSLELLEAALDPTAQGEAETFGAPDLFGGPVPTDGIISEADVDRAVAEWDRTMPAYRGMLEAEIV